MRGQTSFSTGNPLQVATTEGFDWHHCDKQSQVNRFVSTIQDREHTTADAISCDEMRCNVMSDDQDEQDEQDEQDGDDHEYEEPVSQAACHLREPISGQAKTAPSQCALMSHSSKNVSHMSKMTCMHGAVSTLTCA